MWIVNFSVFLWSWLKCTKKDLSGLICWSFICVHCPEKMVLDHFPVFFRFLSFCFVRKNSAIKLVMGNGYFHPFWFFGKFQSVALNCFSGKFTLSVQNSELEFWLLFSGKMAPENIWDNEWVLLRDWKWMFCTGPNTIPMHMHTGWLWMWENMQINLFLCVSVANGRP